MAFSISTASVPTASVPTASEPKAGTARWLRGIALGLGVALALTACGSDSGGSTTPDDVINQGYVSGDGSVRIWAASDRGDAVVLVGDDFAGDPIDTAKWVGDIVVVNTWYAACPPCRAESADLSKVALDRKAEGVRFIGLNRVDSAGAAQAFERTYDVQYPSIADSSGAVTAQLQGVVPVKATPTTVVLDREGRVAARILGGTDATTLNTILSDVIGDTEATPDTDATPDDAVSSDEDTT